MNRLCQQIWKFNCYNPQNYIKTNAPNQKKLMQDQHSINEHTNC